MRLLKYKVHKFRSVKGTEWIEIDKLACFVGVNESGKTNLLLPLWKFNPADDSTEIDLLKDYPRDEYSELDKSDSERKTEPFIEVLFKLDKDELREFNTKYKAFLKPDKSEGGEEKPDELEGGKEKPDESEGGEEKPEAKEIEKVNLSEFLLIKKDYDNNFYIHASDEKCKEKTSNLKEFIGDTLFNEICKRIPKFIYYSEYGNIDSDLYLPSIKEYMTRIESLSDKEKMKVRTLKILFTYLKLDFDEILDLGQESNPNNNPSQKTLDAIDQESRNKRARRTKIETAAKELSLGFKDWWSQGDYTFIFDLDGNHFRIAVKDNERPSPIELESRSKGLQWFLSFFLVFMAESKGDHRGCILLLDEPGLHLHPHAQTDLVHFFDNLSQNNQLIYTTHLPFLVNHNNLARVKAVYIENGLTKISNNIFKADKEKNAIQPVNAAIGITVSQSLLMGCDIVIVEGTTDQSYLVMIKNYLIFKGKIKPKREMLFIVARGSGDIKKIVSIIHSKNSDLPIVLLDSDKAGKQCQKNLKDDLYNSEQDKDKVIEIETFTEKKESEIEDLIPVKLIIDSFNALFKSKRKIKVDDIDPSMPIIPQLKAFAKGNKITSDDRWKAELSKKVKEKFKPDMVADIESKWEALFSKLYMVDEKQPPQKKTIKKAAD